VVIKKEMVREKSEARMLSLKSEKSWILGLWFLLLFLYCDSI
jgi:hypothetical protein